MNRLLIAASMLPSLHAIHAPLPAAVDHRGKTMPASSSATGAVRRSPTSIFKRKSRGDDQQGFAKMKPTRLLFSLPLLLAACALAGTPSVAEERNLPSANAIMPGCRALMSRIAGHSTDTGSDFAMGVCVGIVEGTIYEMSAWQLTTCPAFACLPKEITIEQAVRVVVAYIEARPERMHEQFTLLANLALVTAWPCSKQPQIR
jgi:Rap1a immunity proteins